MVLRLAVLIIGFTVVATPALAQRVEASANIGYTASEGITSDDRVFVTPGAFYDTVSPKSGSSFNFTFGVFVTEQAELEFLWARQSSQLVASGPAAADLPITDMSVYNYHFNFVYNWGMADSRVRPFAFGGLGATQYSFGDVLIAGPPGSGAPGLLDGETQFSSTIGGGVKFYFSPNIGAKVTGRYTPTFITSDPEGVWCDPWYGCWQVVDTEYSNQFDFSAGITIRF